MEKMYLGDSVYLDTNVVNGDLVITTETPEDGKFPSNVVLVAPQLLPDLARYIEQHRLEMARGFDDGVS